MTLDFHSWGTPRMGVEACNLFVMCLALIKIVSVTCFKKETRQATSWKAMQASKLDGQDRGIYPLEIFSVIGVTGNNNLTQYH
jgi:hypothetical protein